ncbi:tyrosine phosphatase family-domain-containing protein [Chytridium lagenaria]|nr:tyrosine phosphatase family-domain-containing protein [Chytridium lagenaria]
MNESEKKLVPPLNFAMVSPGVYRSGYPNKKNFPFLKGLQLRCVMYVCSDDQTEDNTKFFKENGVKLLHYRIKGISDIADALVQVLDRRNHPMLIHCNKGKHKIGCLVGCLRKLQKWSLTSIFDEYRRFAGAKIRIADQEVSSNNHLIQFYLIYFQFIEVFNAPIDYDPNFLPKWLVA